MNLLRYLWPLLLILVLTGGCVPLDEPEDRGETHYILGLSFLQEDDNTRALKEFLAAVKEAPEDARMQHALAQTYQRKKAFELAEKHYIITLRLSENDPDVLNNLGALYLDQGRWEDAARAFRRAADNLLFERPELALTGLGFAQFQSGRYAAAVESLKQAEEINRSYPPLYLHLGNTYFALENLPLAEEAYSKALRLAPDYLEARYRYGLLLLRLEKRREARQVFLDLYRLAPDSSQATIAKHYLDILK